jgi:site-specific DNA-methyltransferase (adenine-specific)
MDKNNQKIIEGDCYDWLNQNPDTYFHLTFLDPPFNQKKIYRTYRDNRRGDIYWAKIKTLLTSIYKHTEYGGGIYFMQREKNIEYMLATLSDAKWIVKNLIIWKKKTSPPPCKNHFNKQYQVIAYATKGKRPRVFNKLKIDSPQPLNHIIPKNDGYYLTDIWDDINELSSGYFAGAEAIRDTDGVRIHLQQTPIALLLRIVLTSTLPGDIVFDPMAGIGTTAVVSSQLHRKSISIEIDPSNAQIIRDRLEYHRLVDDIKKYYDYYRHTPDLNEIWNKNYFG